MLVYEFCQSIYNMCNMLLCGKQLAKETDGAVAIKLGYGI